MRVYQSMNLSMIISTNMNIHIFIYKSDKLKSNLFYILIHLTYLPFYSTHYVSKVKLMFKYRDTVVSSLSIKSTTHEREFTEAACFWFKG